MRVLLIIQLYLYNNIFCMLKKIISVWVVFALSVGWTYSYNPEIDCSTDSVFSQYSCTQCFDWWLKSQGSFIGLLSDDWENASWVSKIMYEEQQDMPEMINLNTSLVSWSQTPSSENFWELTDEFKALYSEDQFGYVLEPGNTVTWLRSNLSYAYSLDKNEASEWENIWLLVYSILAHNILEDGEISMNNVAHKECVLYKSWDTPEVTPVTPPTTLPQTWPAEFFLLLILAMILGFGIIRFRNS